MVKTAIETHRRLHERLGTMAELASPELLDCPRLFARLTQRGCDANRKAGLAACEDCPGLKPSHVITLDFAGNEDVLEALRAVSDDLPQDIIATMDAVISGQLRWREGTSKKKRLTPEKKSGKR